MRAGRPRSRGLWIARTRWPGGGPDAPRPDERPLAFREVLVAVPAVQWSAGGPRSLGPFESRERHAEIALRSYRQLGHERAYAREGRGRARTGRERDVPPSADNLSELRLVADLRENRLALGGPHVGALGVAQGEVGARREASEHDPLAPS